MQVPFPASAGFAAAGGAPGGTAAGSTTGPSVVGGPVSLAAIGSAPGGAAAGGPSGSPTAGLATAALALAARCCWRCAASLLSVTGQYCHGLSIFALTVMIRVGRDMYSVPIPVSPWSADSTGALVTGQQVSGWRFLRSASLSLPVSAAACMSDNPVLYRVGPNWWVGCTLGRMGGVPALSR